MDKELVILGRLSSHIEIHTLQYRSQQNICVSQHRSMWPACVMLMNTSYIYASMLAIDVFKWSPKYAAYVKLSATLHGK